MADQYRALVQSLMKLGFLFRRQGVRKQEVWTNRRTDQEVTFDRQEVAASPAVAAAVLKQAEAAPAANPVGQSSGSGSARRTPARAKAKAPAKRVADAPVKSKPAAPTKSKPAAPAKAKGKATGLAKGAKAAAHRSEH